MIPSRHQFVLETINLTHQVNTILQKATDLEIAGNWYLAGETYRDLDSALTGINDPALEPTARMKITARAASCFEIAGDCRTSARFYEQSARDIVTSNFNPKLAAELFNRAALQFSAASEHFFAGSAWIRAAEEFSKIQSDIITCTENLSPLPMSSLKSHLCGVCFEAAAISFEKSVGNEMWSVGTYWRAEMAYARGIPNIQAFNAYRRSLNNHIKYYGTLKVERLRSTLPLSETERASNVNPIEVMEAALARCNNHHQPQPGESLHSRIQTNRQMVEAFHGFNIELQTIGNAKEAGFFRSQQNERQREIFTLERKFGMVALYTSWKISSNYGESLGRWIMMCLIVVLSFSIAYDGFGAITSGAISTDKLLNLTDYIYFSVITFSTLGYGDLHPNGPLGEILACFEVFFGLTMFGVLLSFLGNRFQRG